MRHNPSSHIPIGKNVQPYSFLQQIVDRITKFVISLFEKIGLIPHGTFLEGIIHHITKFFGSFGRKKSVTTQGQLTTTKTNGLISTVQNVQPYSFLQRIVDRILKFVPSLFGNSGLIPHGSFLEGIIHHITRFLGSFGKQKSVTTFGANNLTPNTQRCVVPNFVWF